MGSDAPQILVVDDEQVIREVLGDVLSMEGFVVETAENGREALALLSRKRFDLVLSDLKMPAMGGIELLKAVKEHAPHTVAIIMTGFGTVETAIDAMKRGAYDYIMKPFKMDEVVHCVRRGLERKKLESDNLRMREALSLYKVSEAIAASLSLDEVMETVTRAAVEEVGADMVSVLLSDGQGGFFERSRRVSADTRRRLNTDDLATDDPATDDLATDDPATDELARPCLGRFDGAALAEHFAEERRFRLHRDKALRFFSEQPRGLQLESMVVTHLAMAGRSIGFLAACSFTAGKRFEEAQRKLLSIVSDRAAAAVENARLYEDLKATFAQTVEGLASAIDKMDRYTAGHSGRVAAYAELLAIKLGLPEDKVEIVRQAALMHDIGKIGCVMNLNKPGILSEQEYEVFKRHPGFGKEILDPIKFLAPIVPGVHLHHERWDGHGYPVGLKAQEIPLVARIVSVADVYDAMTSDRAYRRALPHDATVRELSRCAGSQFDPDVVNEFLEAIETERSERSDRGDPNPA